MFRAATIAALCALAACASAGGSWPSLARRPGAAPPPGAAVPARQPSPTPARPAGVAPAVDVGAAAARLARVRASWQAQQVRAEAAVRAATAASAGDTALTTAELELSRLELHGAEFGDIADEVAVVTSSQQAREVGDAARVAQALHVATFDVLRRQLAAAGR
jgi:hypothetical protein